MSKIADGSLVLLRAYRGWLAPGDVRTTLSRLAGQAGAGALYVFTADYEPTFLLAVPAAGLGWVAAAWAVADTPEGEEEEDGPDEVTPEEFIGVLHEALGDAKGVHLQTLVEALADFEPGFAWDTAAVRHLADAAGVRVTPSVRVGGRVSTGIRATDAPPLPEEGPAVGEVAAGQRATTTTTPTVERIGQGGRILRTEAPQHTTVTPRRHGA